VSVGVVVFQQHSSMFVNYFTKVTKLTHSIQTSMQVPYGQNSNSGV